MTNSYSILSTRVEEPHGTGVTFKVTRFITKTYPDGQVFESEQATIAFVMVPTGEDIDEYLKDYLSRSGINIE
jgi:hypothetical protein